MRAAYAMAGEAVVHDGELDRHSLAFGFPTLLRMTAPAPQRGVRPLALFCAVHRVREGEIRPRRLRRTPVHPFLDRAVVARGARLGGGPDGRIVGGLRADDPGVTRRAGRKELPMLQVIEAVPVEPGAKRHDREKHQRYACEAPEHATVHRAPSGRRRMAGGSGAASGSLASCHVTRALRRSCFHSMPAASGRSRFSS